EHPALDAARDGFKEAMEEAGYKEGVDVVYDLQNAQGDFTNAISIAQKFKDDKGGFDCSHCYSHCSGSFTG
ncbi:unnamed protein product, partial [marine sediment metagenome]